MKKLAALILVLCLLLPCMAEHKSLKDFVSDYNIYADIAGAGELSETDISYDAENGKYRVNDSNRLTILFGNKFDGCSCAAPIAQSIDFMRTATAIYLTVNGSDSIIDFLGMLSYGVMFAGKVNTDNYNFAGNTMFKVTSDGDYYYFVITVIA